MREEQRLYLVTDNRRTRIHLGRLLIFAFYLLAIGLLAVYVLASLFGWQNVAVAVLIVVAVFLALWMWETR